MGYVFRLKLKWKTQMDVFKNNSMLDFVVNKFYMCSILDLKFTKQVSLTVYVLSAESRRRQGFYNCISLFSPSQIKCDNCFRHFDYLLQSNKH